jgi:alkylation response protein AidB-like acyl-CoA dehydrogenase
LHIVQKEEQDMPAYKAPVEDMMFVLKDVLGAGQVFAEIPAYAEIDTDVVGTVLEEAGRFCAGSPAAEHERRCRGLPPGRRRGADAERFAEAYGGVLPTGWGGLSASPDHGGQGLPRTVQILVDEMLSAANLSFRLFPGLTRGRMKRSRRMATKR